jgi:hypothetical protein
MLPAGHSREPFAGRKTNDSDFGPKHYEAVCPLPPQKMWHQDHHQASKTVMPLE